MSVHLFYLNPSIAKRGFQLEPLYNKTAKLDKIYNKICEAAIRAQKKIVESDSTLIDIDILKFSMATKASKILTGYISDETSYNIDEIIDALGVAAVIFRKQGRCFGFLDYDDIDPGLSFSVDIFDDALEKLGNLHSSEFDDWEYKQCDRYAEYLYIMSYKNINIPGPQLLRMQDIRYRGHPKETVRFLYHHLN